MTQTRIQTRIQKYDKKTHTKNAYKCMTKNHKKTAYKCMTKIRVQTRIQMYDKNTRTNTHTNV